MAGKGRGSMSTPCPSTAYLAAFRLHPSLPAHPCLRCKCCAQERERESESQRRCHTHTRERERERGPAVLIRGRVATTVPHTKTSCSAMRQLAHNCDDGLWVPIGDVAIDVLSKPRRHTLLPQVVRAQWVLVEVGNRQVAARECGCNARSLLPQQLKRGEAIFSILARENILQANSPVVECPVGVERPHLHLERIAM
eukprot:COSAG03_NODE_2017_length_3211_cov_1.522172_1_plen_197_part_00